MVWHVAFSLIPLGFLFVGLAVMMAFVRFWLHMVRKNRRDSPLTRNLLRSPGHSLRKRIDDLSGDIESLLAASLAAPVLVYASHISVSYFGNQPETTTRILASVIAGSIFLVVPIRQLFPLLHERRKLTLGLEGELATGEELNQLMLVGCRVFHDIEYPYGNIDHVVVSQSGVYCVNTKMRGKPKGTDEQARLLVDHGRKMLRFPDGEYPIPVAAAETESKWLSEFLSSAVGSSIKAEPMLAYPGWYIERIGRGEPFVFNPHKPHKFFVRSRLILTPELVQQVAHQLEQRCRDVEPLLRESKRWKTAESKA